MTPAEKLEAMTKDQRSLLLYLETCAVDHGGLVGGMHMNAEDFKIAEAWNESGFIRFSRIPTHLWDKVAPSKSPEFPPKPRHVVDLSAEAWFCVSMERRRRAERSQRDDIVGPSLEHFSKK